MPSNVTTSTTSVMDYGIYRDYYLFLLVYRQDSMDLLLGNIAVQHRSPTAFLKEDSIWILAWLVALFSIVAPSQVRYRYQLIVIAFIMVFVIFFAKLLRVRGRKVVNIPQLPRRLKQKTG